MTSDRSKGREVEAFFIRLPEVREITQLSKAYIYKLMSKGEFPKNVALNRRTVVWQKKDVLQWCEDKVKVSLQGS